MRYSFCHYCKQDTMQNNNNNMSYQELLADDYNVMLNEKILVSFMSDFTDEELVSIIIYYAHSFRLCCTKLILQDTMNKEEEVEYKRISRGRLVFLRKYILMFIFRAVIHSNHGQDKTTLTFWRYINDKQ